MRAEVGELDQRIQVEREVSSSDGMGGYTSTWSVTHGPLWARVRPKSGRERQFSAQVQDLSDYVVIMRNRDLDEADRIKWVSNGNRILNIRAIHREPRAQFIQVEVELGANQ